ncbi:MAG: cupredoxin domain-containing protein [Chloroflexi bacterium]|nr:cupredoxin domain-containing protein [Chloroflexota bacterium]
MKPWLPVVLLGLLLVGAVTYFLVLQVPSAPVVQATSSHGDVPGLKRDPGTFHEGTIAVVESQASLGTPDVTIDIDIMRPVFLPNVITVKKDQVVRLRLHGKDNGLTDALAGSIGLQEYSGHGFQILGPYDVWITGIRKDETKEVTFKAAVAGEFPFECVVLCDPMHYLMQGKLVVEQ